MFFGVFYLVLLANVLPSCCVHCVDYRTHRDRTERCTAAFEKQMDNIVDAYLEWSFATSLEGGVAPPGPAPADSGVFSIRVVDTFGKYEFRLSLYY